MKILYGVIFYVFILCVPANAQPHTLSFGINSGPKSFASAAVLSAAYSRINIDVDLVALPPGRSLVEKQSGRLDGEVHRIRQIEHNKLNLVIVPFPINKFEGMAYTLRQDLAYDGWLSLRPLRVGVEIGVAFSEEGTRGFSHVLQKPDLDALFDLLPLGRLDVVIAPRAVFERQKMRLKDDNLHVLEPPLVVHELYHYVNKRHEALIPELTEILRDMSESGELDRIKTQAFQAYWDQYPVD